MESNTVTRPQRPAGQTSTSLNEMVLAKTTLTPCGEISLDIHYDLMTLPLRIAVQRGFFLLLTRGHPLWNVQNAGVEIKFLLVGLHLCLFHDGL